MLPCQRMQRTLSYRSRTCTPHRSLQKCEATAHSQFSLSLKHPLGNINALCNKKDILQKYSTAFDGISTLIALLSLRMNAHHLMKRSPNVASLTEVLTFCAFCETRSSNQEIRFWSNIRWRPPFQNRRQHIKSTAWHNSANYCLKLGSMAYVRNYKNDPSLKILQSTDSCL
jgi:hypothetical protein